MVELLQGRAIIRVIHPDGTEPEAPPALLAIDKYRFVAALFSPLPADRGMYGLKLSESLEGAWETSGILVAMTKPDAAGH